MGREKPIINCHTHLFTLDHVPRDYFPRWARLILKFAATRKSLIRLLRSLLPGRRDIFDRWANLAAISSGKCQADIFQTLKGYYPTTIPARFVVLPMDMELMGYGHVPVDIRAQHSELACLRDQYPDLIIPFAHVDPRRTDAVKLLTELVDTHQLCGVKIYPPLGYHLDHPVLLEMFAFCAERSLPVMTHCAQDGVREKGIAAEAAHDRTEPTLYQKVLEQFPDLRLCLGHFGGDRAWGEYLDRSWLPDDDKKPPVNWLSQILEMLTCGRYPNLYVDISYTLFDTERFGPILKVLLQDESIRDRVLYGSDFYMVEQAAKTEREFSMDIRALLGEDLFWQIAHHNPLRYIGETSHD